MMIDHIQASSIHICPRHTLLNMLIQKPVPKEMVQKGRNGEVIAKEWLLKNGYIVIKEQVKLFSNVYSGKIDYIAIKDGEQIVIEVKSSDKKIDELISYYQYQCSVYRILTGLPVFLMVVRSTGTIEMVPVEPVPAPLPTLEEVKKGVKRKGPYCNDCWYRKLCEIVEIKEIKNG